MLNNQRVSLVSGCTRYLTSQQLKKIRTLSILQLWCSSKRQKTSQHAQGKGSIRKMVWQKKSTMFNTCPSTHIDEHGVAYTIPPTNPTTINIINKMDLPAVAT